MEQAVIIRKAVHADAQGMADFTAEIVAEKLDTILLDRAFSRAEEEETIARYGKKEHWLFLLALDGARVVGMLDLKAGERPGNRHMGAFGLSVAADYRGQGIGRRLLVRMIEEARGWDGFCRIELGVTPWNVGAIALYESVGFVHEGVKTKGVNLRGVPEDDLMMALVW